MKKMGSIKTRKMFTSSPIPPLNRNCRVRVTIETSAPARLCVFICDKAKPNTTVCTVGGVRTAVNTKDKEEETFFHECTPQANASQPSALRKCEQIF